MSLLRCIVVATTVTVVQGGARLVEPPMRSSLWRNRYPNVTINKADDFVNCGGFAYQWDRAGGSCGACGDPLYGPSDHIYPGKYATNIKAHHINQGEMMNITVFVDMNQLGYFQFNFCPQSEITGAMNLGECFRLHPLVIWETNSTKYYMGSPGGFFHLHLLLPPNLHCPSCVLQWVYVTGYRTGRDQANSRDCLGCGPQETYINCADFTINQIQTQHPFTPHTIPSSPQAPANPPQAPANPFNAASNPPVPPPINTTAPSGNGLTEPLISPANSPLPPSNLLNEKQQGSSANSSSAGSGKSFNAMKIDIYEDLCLPLSTSLTCEPSDIADWCLKKCRQNKRCPSPACRCGCVLRDGKKYPIGPNPISIVIRSPITLPGQNGTLCFKPNPDRAMVTGMPIWCSQNCPGDRCFEFCSAQKC